MIKLEPLYDSIRILDISDEEYFSKEYSGYISNSRLTLINPEQGGSTEKYLGGLSNNPQYSDSLVFGSAVHQLVLQPESFEVAEGVERPTAKMGAMADELYNKEVTDDTIIQASNKISYYKDKMNPDRIQNVKDSCKDYWRDRALWESKAMTKDPIYLDLKSREKLAACITSVENSRPIQDLLHPVGLLNKVPSFNERTLFIDVKATYENKSVILKLKAKLDNFTINIENNEVTLNDLKTTGHYLDKFKESFDRYHYYRQMAELRGPIGRNVYRKPL